MLFNVAVRNFRTVLEQLGFTLYGKADICTIAFSHPRHSCNSIQTLMKRREWSISLLQMPLALHFSFTPLNSTKVDQLIKDIKEVVAELETST